MKFKGENILEFTDRFPDKHSCLAYLSGSKLNKGEYLILVSFNKPEKADFYYKQRWQIELLFKQLKQIFH